VGDLQSYLAVRAIEAVQSYPARIAFAPDGFTPEALQSYLVLASVLAFVGLAVQNDLTTFLDSSDEESTSPDTESDTDSSATETDGGQPRGVIYARVSSQRQAEDGHSLREQEENLRRIAEERDINLVAKPIKDAGETGTNFDRPGIRKVRRLACQDEIEYVLVDAIDRVGRTAAETTYYLHELRTKCGVRVITAESGELDVSKFEDLVPIVLDTLMSQRSNETRARRARMGRIEQFSRKNWSAFYSSAPLGYQYVDDDWLAVDSSEVETVRRLFETFLEVDIQGAYSATEARVAGYSSSSSHALKRLLQNRVYIGKPGIDAEHPETGERVFVEDSDLQIVEGELFERVQKKIEVIQERYSTDSGESDSPDGLEDVVSEFGLEPVVDSCEMAQLHCMDCGGDVVKNGQRTLTDRTVHNYKCTECGRQRKFPTENELSQLRESVS